MAAKSDHDNSFDQENRPEYVSIDHSVEQEKMSEDSPIDNPCNTEEDRRKKRTSSWIISFLVHLIVLVFLSYWVIAQPEKKEDVIITTTVIPNEAEEEPVKEIELVKHEVEIKSDVMVESPVVTSSEVTEDRMETESESDEQSAEGVSDAISDMPLVGSGLMSNLGGGGGGGGAFGARSGGAKKKALLRNGGSKKTESSVDAALAWLKRHQEPDGHWDGMKYGAGGKVAKDGTMTGLALLAFLAAGHTAKAGKYRNTVSKAQQWLLSQQKDDGAFVGMYSHSIYENAICTLALSEAYAMDPNPDLKKAAQKGVDYIANADAANKRNLHHGEEGGEKGVPHSIGVFGWVLMALKSAKVAGLSVPKDLFDKLKARLDKVTDKEEYGRVHNCEFDHEGKCMNTGVMAGVALLSYAYLGVSRVNLLPIGELMLKRLPSQQDFDLYRWYYTTLALFQIGGEPWKVWNKALSEVLTATQKKGGPLDGSLLDVDGSWDPDIDEWGAGKRLGRDYGQGRVYTTAMAAFCLEVYYRYESVYRH